MVKNVQIHSTAVTKKNSPRETMDGAVTSRGLNGRFIHPEPRTVQDYRFVFVAPKNSVVHW